MSVQIHHTKTKGIHFSESAKNHVLSYLLKDPEYKGVRLSVKKTGCSGFSYVVDYVKTPSEGDIITLLSQDYIVCIDKASFPILKNMEVDFIKEGFNSKLVFHNPNQTGECGCGESFTVD